MSVKYRPCSSTFCHPGIFRHHVVTNRAKKVTFCMFYHPFASKIIISLSSSICVYVCVCVVCVLCVCVEVEWVSLLEV